ncbi:MAG: hypothetical protein U0Q15_07265 [Kineosporiaceae bacterium]
MSGRRRRPTAARVAGGLLACGALTAGGLAAYAAAPEPTIWLTGTVTDAATGAGLAGLCVAPMQWFAAPPCTAEELTDSYGEYRRQLAVPSDAKRAGQVGVRPTAADPYHVMARARLALDGSGTYTVNLALTPVGTLTGRVVDSAGTPVAAACPQLRGLDVSALPSAPVPQCSGLDGVWKLTGVPAGKAAVVLSPTSTLQGSYVPRGSRFDLATQYTVVPGTSTSLPDTVLTPGGTLTVSTSGAGRGFNVITLRPMKRSQDVVPTDRYTTGAESSVNDPEEPVLRNVQAGDYLVLVENVWDPSDCYEDTPLCSSLAPWWAPGTVDPGRARQVHIGAGESVELQAKLQPYKTLKIAFPGVPTGTAVAVQAYFPSGKPWAQPVQAVVTSAGVGVASFLPPSDVRLRFTYETPDGKRTSWWNGGANLATATVVKADVTDITATVPGKKTTKTKKK